MLCFIREHLLSNTSYGCFSNGMRLVKSQMTNRRKYNIIIARPPDHPCNNGTAEQVAQLSKLVLNLTALRETSSSVD